MATQYFFITPQYFFITPLKKKHTIWAFKNRSKTPPSQSGPGPPEVSKPT